MAKIIKIHRYIYFVFFILILVSQTCIYDAERDNHWDGKTARPKFSPEGGPYDTDQLVSITSATAGATIYYTTDGSDPTTSSSVYTAPVPITSDGTSIILKAIAVKDGLKNSVITNAPFMITYPKKVTTIAGLAGSSGFIDGIGSEARFTIAAGITADNVNLYTPDQSGIRKIIISNETVSTISCTGSCNGCFGGGGYNDIHCLFPFGITTDLTSGVNLYSTGCEHNIKKMIISTGEQSVIAGSTTGESGYIDGIGTEARFFFPNGIATDGIKLYVVESWNCTIREIVISTGVVTTIAGLPDPNGGMSGYADGIGSEARFCWPTDIVAVDENLYVTDSGNHIIRKINISSQLVTTFAGSAGIIGTNDGISSEARFNYPEGITTDGKNLYVADTSNHTIRKIAISSGLVVTIAGLAGNNGSSDGTASEARFNYPEGIAFNGTNLYVADTENYTIRKIE